MARPMVVFNIHARDSFDNKAIDLMLTKVAQIVRDMVAVNADYTDAMQDEILGEMLENLDLAAILQSATDMRLDLTKEQIDDAIARAREAQKLQDEVLSYVEGFDPRALQGITGFTMQHVQNFAQAMMPRLGVEIIGALHNGRMLDIRLPEALKGRFAEFGQRTVLRLTADRSLARNARDACLLDFESEFFQWLIERAKEHSFDGLYASVAAEADQRGVLAGFLVRWQNDQGEPTTQEFLPIMCGAVSGARVHPESLGQWFSCPAVAAPVPKEGLSERRAHLDAAGARAERYLAEKCSRFNHPNGLVLLAAADLRAG
jgi:hypothetical protein